MATDVTSERTLEERLRDDALIEEALARAVREALQRHKQAANPIVVWRDGRVVWISSPNIFRLLNNSMLPAAADSKKGSVSPQLRCGSPEMTHESKGFYSSVTLERVRLVRLRTDFACRRRSTEARVGRVARRGLGVSAARRISAIRRARASSRLRS